MKDPRVMNLVVVAEVDGGSERKVRVECGVVALEE